MTALTRTTTLALLVAVVAYAAGRSEATHAAPCRRGLL